MTPRVHGDEVARKHMTVKVITILNIKALVQTLLIV